MGHIDLSADMPSNNTVAQAPAMEDALTQIQDVINGNLDATNFAAGVLVVPAGTSFPTSPIDGQEYIYIADATNGVFWRFRYNVAHTYWAFIGGPPLTSKGTGGSTSSSTFASIGSAGAAASIVVPFAGTYEIKWGGRITNSTDATKTFLGYASATGGTLSSTDPTSVEYGEPSGSITTDYTSIFGEDTAALTAATYTLYGGCSGGLGEYAANILKIVPVKK